MENKDTDKTKKDDNFVVIAVSNFVTMSCNIESVPEDEVKEVLINFNELNH